MIYVVHIEPPLEHAAHYVGYTKHDDVEIRFAEHLAGKGAKLLKAAVERGHELRLVRVMEGDRNRERQLKRNGGHGPALCPECRPAYLERRREYDRRRVRPIFARAA